MTNDWRIVVDTNIAVSAALLPRSVPRQAFDFAMSGSSVLVSAETIFELEEVLSRPKFDRYVTEGERLEFLAALILEADTIEVIEIINECRNAKDDKFLELAVSGHATHIISGDADLLSLHPFRGISILTPSAYLQLAKGLQS